MSLTADLKNFMQMLTFSRHQKKIITRTNIHKMIDILKINKLLILPLVLR